MAINFRGKIGKNRPVHLNSLLWHSETDWNFEISIGALTAAMIWLHRIKIW